MARRIYLFTIGFILSLFLLLAVQPTVAQPALQEPSQEGEPEGTPPPDKPAVDWASVQMEGDEGDFFPEPASPVPDKPEPSDDEPPPPAPDEGPPPPSSGSIAVTPAPGEITHVVQAGDTLYEIAKRYGIALDQLVAANSVQDPRRLKLGQVLVIPGAAAPPSQAATVPQVAEVTAAIEPGGTYVVRRGDSPYKIARRLGVSLEALMAVNQISDPRHLNVGQVLVLPGDGVPVVEAAAAPVVAATPVPAPATEPPAEAASAGPYLVKRGDTVSRIARRFGVSTEALIAANHLANPDRIDVGQSLTIPGLIAGGPPEAPPATPVPPAPPTPAPTEPPVVVTASAPAGDGPFIWPIPLQDGWIPKGYRAGHRGVDIILPLGTPIRAAAGGTVEFSGWNGYGFGNLVVLDHGNGYRTLYAHQSERLVAEGDVVAQGDVIGLVGSTGRSTHPHLHFEIRQGYAPVNPCDQLPGGCQQ